MNSTMLVIALLMNGNMHIEAVYPMQSFGECEEVSRHQAVMDSYPDRLIFCWDGEENMRASWRKAAKSRTAGKAGPVPVSGE